jgi:hypothetical protein
MIQTAFALLLTLASACALNWGYLSEHQAASRLPQLSPRRPVHSFQQLLGSRRWMVGFGSEMLGFGLYVAALALAPLALVQAVAAGGIGILALLVARVTRTRLEGRERAGVAIAVGGLVLLGISLAGGSEHGTSGSWLLIGLWLAASLTAATVAISLGASLLRGGAAFGVTAGILFAAGDIATKAAVSGGDYLIVAPAIVAFYAAGTIVLQMGFQRGRALTSAGIAVLGTNAIPIAAAMTLFAEPLPAGAMGILRLIAFAAVVAGAVALAPSRNRPPAATTDSPQAPAPAEPVPTGRSHSHAAVAVTEGLPPPAPARAGHTLSPRSSPPRTRSGWRAEGGPATAAADFPRALKAQIRERPARFTPTRYMLAPIDSRRSGVQSGS